MNLLYIICYEDHRCYLFDGFILYIFVMVGFVLYIGIWFKCYLSLYNNDHNSNNNNIIIFIVIMFKAQYENNVRMWFYVYKCGFFSTFQASLIV